MHENKFEKQMREKMDQLGFDPSDAVWAHVDQAINTEKKRRRPIFWIFFLSGLMVAGGATYMVMNNFSSAKKIMPELPQAASNNQYVQPNKAIPTEQKRQNESVQQKLPLVTPAMNAGRSSGSFQSRKPLLVTAETDSRSKKSNGNASHTVVVKKEVEQKPANLQQPLESPAAGANTLSKEDPQAASVSGEKTNKTVPADSVSGAKTGKSNKKDTKKNSWSVSFTGSVGASNINQSLFQSYNPSNLLYSAYYPTNSGSIPSAGTNTPSETNAGFSFVLGASVNRMLSKRLSLSIGLGYHYYSTGIQTGVPVDSTLTVNYGFTPSTSINSFYRNDGGKKFTNQYHFIELPVNLSFQMNKSRKNPVNWEAGVTLAWLVGANALHYDPYTNVYFKNNQLFNKIQWNAATAILVGFPVLNHSFQLGPQIQYALTSLIKENGAYPGHLIYYGLKCSFNF